MTHLLRILIAVLLLASATQPAWSATRTKTAMKSTTGKKSTSDAPDFAFPEEVIKTSRADLDKALSSGDTGVAVRSLIQYTLAQTSIDTGRAAECIELIEKTRDGSTDPVFKAVLNTLLATVYSDIYSDNRWKYDRRSLPLTPRDKDFNLWSGEQFRQCILEHIDLALVDRLRSSRVASRNSRHS